MKNSLSFIALTRTLISVAAVLALLTTTVSGTETTRILILPDIENEPDDPMSMVRFLTYANQFDVEGLVATTSVHQQNKTAAWRIREIVKASFVVPTKRVMPPGTGTMHIILAVTDKGTPPLTRYQRVIVDVREQQEENER